MEKLIRTNSRGRLLYSIEKNEFYIEFGLVNFTLSMQEYLVFERELKIVSNDFSMYSSTNTIKVPVNKAGFSLKLTPEELISFKDLFGFKTKDMISFKLKINYSMN
ncbi:MAG: hypothetical protein JEZ09_17330 [Salinivirgaceae bacterium]|nr:hypothetical protein [Salinivirgaceae bacterium]